MAGRLVLTTIATAVTGATTTAAQPAGAVSTGPDSTLLSDIQLEQLTTDSHARIVPIVTSMDCGIDGFSTFRLSLQAGASSDAANVYAVFGDQLDPVTLPAAYQVAAPFGTNLAGSNPALFDYSPEAASDSWLTVGPTTGDPDNKISSVGIQFDQWTEHEGIQFNNGAIFWMDPKQGPSLDEPVVVAQLSTVTGEPASVTLNAQGHRLTADDSGLKSAWEARALQFDLFTASAGSNTPWSPSQTASHQPNFQAPPGETEQTLRCSPSALQTEFARIEQTCCADADVDCSFGPPSTCTSGCANLVLDLISDCASVVEAVSDRKLQEFIGSCQALSAESPPRHIGTSLKIMDDVATNVAGASTAELVQCSYTALTGIAMQCADDAIGSQFLNDDVCSTNCGKALLPFIRNCNDAAWSTAIDGFGLSSIGAILTEHCAGDTAITCPSSDDLAGICHSEMPAGPLAVAPDIRCANPCTVAVELAQSSRCTSSPTGRDVARLTGVSAQTWNIVRRSCTRTVREDTKGVVQPSAAPSPNSHLSKCSQLSGVIVPYIGVECAANEPGPTACSEDCASVVSAFVHVCSEYVANDPELMSSLAARTRMCETGVV